MQVLAQHSHVRNSYKCARLYKQVIELKLTSEMLHLGANLAKLRMYVLLL